MNCYYCENGDFLKELMIKVCDLQCSKVYLFKDQTHIGKCIVVYNDHKTEIFQLTKEEQHKFVEDFSAVAQAIYDIYEPAKINYAIYGDCVSHLHVHVTPKYKDGVDWGKPFRDDREPTFLEEEQYKISVEKIRKYLKNEGIL